MLLTIIPADRDFRALKEEQEPDDTFPEHLSHPPMS